MFRVSPGGATLPPSLTLTKSLPASQRPELEKIFFLPLLFGLILNRLTVSLSLQKFVFCEYTKFSFCIIQHEIFPKFCLCGSMTTI